MKIENLRNDDIEADQICPKERSLPSDHPQVLLCMIDEVCGRNQKQQIFLGEQKKQKVKLINIMVYNIDLELVKSLSTCYNLNSIASCTTCHPRSKN